MNTLGFQSQVVGQMLPHDIQQTNERRFAKKHLYSYLDKVMSTDPDNVAYVKKGLEIVNAWLDHWLAEYNGQCSSENYHKTKSTRLSQLKELDLELVVRDILGCIALDSEPQLLVSTAGKCASRLGWSDRKESLLTVSELLAVLRFTEAFSITRDEDSNRMKIENFMKLPQELINAIERAKYLPPLVSAPEELTSNYESPYITFNESLILGNSINGHNDDICLDIINTQNSVPLKLALDFLCTEEEQPNPSSAMDTAEKQRNWATFKLESYRMYSLMEKQGNCFYIPNKVDARLRLYSQGYFINTQGTAFKKASIEFHEEQLIEGYPS